MGEIQGSVGLKKNKMSIFAMVAFVYCSVAGGAFGIEEMVPLSGPTGTIAVLIILAIAWALPYSLMVSELTSLFPGDGSGYLWARKSLGEFWAFQAGWADAVSYYVCGASLVVLATNYISTLFGLSQIDAMMVKISIVVIFAVINLRGFQESSWASVAFSVVIILVFAVITVVGFANFNISFTESMVSEETSVIGRLGESFGIGIWMYMGWEVISNLAGEVEDTKALSRSILIAVPLVALSYILPTLAALGSVGDWINWGGLDVEGSVGYHTVLSTYVGPVAAAIFLGIAAIGQLANYNTNVAGGSRTFFVMSFDKLFPPFMGKISKKRGVPSVGIITISVVTIIFMQFEFTTLVLIQVVCSLLYAIVVAVCVVKARIMHPIENRGNKFIIPGGRTGLGICVGLVVSVVVLALLTNGLDYFVMGILFFATTGPLLYLICKRRYGGLSESDPKHYPLNVRTRLAKGDMGRFASLFSIYGVVSILGALLIYCIEHETGPAYYAEQYADAGVLLSWLGDFNLVLTVLVVLGIAMILLGIILRFMGKRIDPIEDKTKTTFFHWCIHISDKEEPAAF